jgi:hypothetical protein
MADNRVAETSPRHGNFPRSFQRALPELDRRLLQASSVPLLACSAAVAGFLHGRQVGRATELHAQCTAVFCIQPYESGRQLTPILNEIGTRPYDEWI